MSDTQTETLGETEQPTAVEEATPSPSSAPLPEQIAPMEVVQEFVAAVNNGSIRRELADDCILSFFGRHSRGATVAASYLRVLISARYQHEGFEEAAFVTPAKAEQLKSRFMRSFAWVRRRMVEQKRERPATLHLRAESDDEEEQPSRCPAQQVTPPRAASHDLDQLKFVEANGVLKSLMADFSDGSLDYGNSRTVHLTLGYRQVPLVFGSGRDIEICLAIYEKYPGTPSSHPIQRRGSAARCNPSTDDEGEDDSHTRRSARRTLFAEGYEEEESEDPLAEVQHDEQESEQEQQPALERTQVEATTEEEVAQPSGSQEPTAPSSSYTPRKRHSTTNEDEVEPKRTPGRNRLRF